MTEDNFDEQRAIEVSHQIDVLQGASGLIDMDAARVVILPRNYY
jgi:hypothetical protein